MNAAPSKAYYGFDAPGVMRGLLSVGLAGVGVGWIAAVLADGWLEVAAVTLAVVTAVPLVLGLSMVGYGLIGKHRMRDRMLGRIHWRGDEQVLDIGTGRGLLLIGAAKRLRGGGRATGIDIWRAEDLTDNTLDRLAENVGVEGVEDSVALMTEDARKLSFPDASFDVVLSLYCIHNIEDKSEQKAALLEIVRVLKPGGRALIGEWLPTHRYADIFSAAGMTVHGSRTYFSTALALMWMVDAQKPETVGAGNKMKEVPFANA